MEKTNNRVNALIRFIPYERSIVMWQQKSFETSYTYGTLYLVPTPIGNLEDITFRALNVLKEVSVIAAEDTRHTKKLCNYFDIDTPVVSYHEHNKEASGEKLIQELQDGKSIALVSDAGLPTISDPGYELVVQALDDLSSVDSFVSRSEDLQTATIQLLKDQERLIEELQQRVEKRNQFSI